MSFCDMMKLVQKQYPGFYEIHPINCNQTDTEKRVTFLKNLL